jgi:GT2 family glycosyltransferase
MSKSIAVIIPSLNSPIIDQVIAAVLAQGGVANRPEIIVVGRDESGLIPSQSGVRFVDTGEPVWASVARNRGTAVTNADLLVYLDSDCLPTASWLAEHLRAHAAGHQVVGGGVKLTGHNYWSLTYNVTLFHEFATASPPGPRLYMPTLNLSVNRQVVEKVGGLNEELKRAHDIEWTLRMTRAGFQPYFWPTATVEHRHNRESWLEVWRDCVRSAYYTSQIRRQNSDLLSSSVILSWPVALLMLSPLIAALTVGKILWQRPYIWQYWQTLPAVYLTKIGWCYGASRAWRQSFDNL